MIEFQTNLGVWWPKLIDRNIDRDYQDIMKSLATIKPSLQYCEHKRCAIQAGGHVGLWPRQLAKTFDIVHTFEPHKAMFEALLLNCKESRNIKAHPIALGENAGVGNLIETGNPARSHIAIGRAEEIGKPVTVTTIDAMQLPVVDAIYLDVEAYEPSVLRGARETIARCRPVIQVELLPRSAGEITDTLASMGYRFIVRAGRDGLFLS